MKLLVILLTILIPQSVFGYQVESAFGDPCHERISLSAYLNSSLNLTPPEDLKLPDNEIWKQVSEALLAKNDLVIDNEVRRFIVVSLLIGLISPDTDGHAVLDLSALRALHTAEDGQYLHGLRGVDDDGEEGNAIAVTGIRNQVLASLAQGNNADDIIEVEVSMEFYERVPIEVSAKAYYFGRAMHTLQDSFSHTIRSPNTRRIYHVMNYVEAIQGDLDESKDGMAHSDSMDGCGEATSPMYNAAREATIHLLTASAEPDPEVREKAVIEMLDQWVTYESGCTLANNYCESKWVKVAREAPTGPYLGCSVAPKETIPVWPMVFVGLLFGARRKK